MATIPSEAAPTRRQPKSVRGKDFYVRIFRSTPQARIAMIRSGVLAGDAKQMISDLHFDQQALLRALNLKIATVNRKAARGEISADPAPLNVLYISRLAREYGMKVLLSGAGGKTLRRDGAAALRRQN